MKSLTKQPTNLAALEMLADEIVKQFRDKPDSARILYGLGSDATEADVRAAVLAEAKQDAESLETWSNNVYDVKLRRLNATLVHLAITSPQPEARFTWEELRQIKNQLIGEHAEAVELFPRESRMAETDARHLWVVDDAAFQFPFGFKNAPVEAKHEPRFSKKY